MKEAKFKQTEIGLIPEDWVISNLNSTCDINPAFLGRKPKEFFYIDLESVADGVLLKKQIIQSCNAPSRAQRQIRINDILYQTVRPYQRNNLFVDFECSKYIASTGYAVLRAKEGVSCSRFLYYVLLTDKFVNQVLDRCTGTSYPAINPSSLSEIQFVQPLNVTEQERIAEALSDVDGLLRELDAEIAKKRAIKQGAMQELLTGKRRLEGFEGEWEEKKLGEIGFTFNGLTGKTIADFGNGEARYITFLNVLNNPIINTKIFEKVNVRPTEKQNAVRKFDLFFNTSSETPEEVGTCSVLLDEVSNVYLNSFCFGYRLIDEKVSGLYLAYYFRCKLGRELMTSLAQGSTRYNLSKDHFLKSSILLPNTLDEQTAIAKILSDMDADIEALEAKRAKYAAVKQGMMQELLTGKIRLVD